MSDNLQAVREAITKAKEDRDECLRFFRPVIRGTYQIYLWEQFARLEADVHELDLLRKIELGLIATGKETEVMPTEHTEGTENLNQGGSEA